MKFNKLPSQEQIRKVLDYDLETGVFTWRHRSGVSKSWNTRYAGTIAGSSTSNRYLNIIINYEKFRAHRLAWVYVHGDTLDEFTEIDHVNRERTNNVISNLRLATKSLNGGNRVGHSRKGLPKGVTSNHGRFMAAVMVDRKKHYLGTYDTPEEAHAAYIAAARKYKGEFARAA